MAVSAMMEVKRLKEVLIKYLQWRKHTGKNPLFDNHSQHMQNIWQFHLSSNTMDAC